MMVVDSRHANDGKNGKEVQTVIMIQSSHSDTQNWVSLWSLSVCFSTRLQKTMEMVGAVCYKYM
mgnify:CR=1 FL=1